MWLFCTTWATFSFSVLVQLGSVRPPLRCVSVCGPKGPPSTFRVFWISLRESFRSANNWVCQQFLEYFGWVMDENCSASPH